MSAAALLMILLSWFFRRQIRPGLKVICWLIIAAGFLIPFRPAVFSLPKPDFVPSLNELPIIRDVAAETAQERNAANMMEQYNKLAIISELSADEFNGFYFSNPGGNINTTERIITRDTTSGSIATTKNTAEMTKTQHNISYNDAIKQNTFYTALSQNISAVLKIFPIESILLFSWALGAVISLSIILKNHFSLMRKIKKWSIPVTDKALIKAADEVSSLIKLKRKINLSISPPITTPVTLGLIHPSIILPADTPSNEASLGTSDNAYADTEQRFMLMHEALHIKRGDLWKKLPFLFIRIVHWFNPLVYFISHIVDSEIEMACDAAVLKFTGEEHRKLYGETVLQTAKRTWLPVHSFISAFSGSGKNIKRRLSAIIENRKIKRWIAVCCAFVLFAGVIAGGLVSCRDGGGEIGDASQDGTAGNRETINWSSTMQFDPPEITYLAETIDIHDLFAAYNAEGFHRFVLSGDLIYCTAFITGELKEIKINDKISSQLARSIQILSLNINTMETSHLTGYTPAVYSQELPATDDIIMEYSSINSITVDNDGNIILIERVGFNSFDASRNLDLSDENITIWDYHSGTEFYFIIRKLDSNGIDLTEPVTILDMPDTSDSFTIFDMAVDQQGNVYVKYSTYSDYFVYVYDSDGKMLFNLSMFTWNGWKLFRLPSGNVAAYWWHTNERELWEINVESESWGQTIKLYPDTSITVTPVFSPGNEEYPIIFSDNTYILGFNPDTNETMEILNRVEANIPSYDFIPVVAVLDDGRVLMINRSFDNETESTHINIFKEISFEDLQNRTILTLAALNVDADIIKTVSEFNAASSTHYIQVIDYSVHAGQGPDGWMAALDKLSLDITTGKIPDMLAASRLMPLHKYAPIGLLEDIYPFLDNDAELSRDSFVDGVLRAIEINGKLFRVLPSFGIMTIIGHPNFVGDYPGWNMDEFQAVLRANPQADAPLGSYATRDNFLIHNFILFSEQFVDWEAGTADFDNDIFAGFLESIAMLPAETGRDMNVDDDSELIATGRQIMREIYFTNFEQYQVYKTVFGGDIVFKGYPSDNRRGSALYIDSYSGGIAMTVTCTDKDAAWEFIRTFLQEDWQRKNVSSMFAELLPVNKVVFESRLEKAMQEHSSPQILSWWEFTVPVAPLTEEDADKIRELVANAANGSGWDMHLWNIVSEEASKFFSGIGTARDAARIIQSRAAILMSEQVG